MTEETTGVAEAPPVESPAIPAVETAEAPETVEAPEVQELELERGKSQPGARRNARKRAEALAARYEAQRTQAEAAKERALGQPREEAGKPEGGQFKKDAVPQAAEEPAADTAVASLDAPVTQETATSKAAVEGSQVDTSAAKAPDGWVDIPLPENHPLRARGKTSIRALKEEEADVRNGINAAVRLRETELERDRLARDNALLEARREALSGNLPDPERDPKVQTLLQQIRDAEGFGEEMANEVLAGLKARSELAVLKAEQQAEQGVQLQRTAARIAMDIESQANEVFQVWTQSGEVRHRVPNLIHQYFTAVDARNARDGVDIPPSVKEFFAWAQPAYRADPRVQAAIDTIRKQDMEREREKIRAEERAALIKAREKEAADAARRHAAKPPTSRALPSTSTPVAERTGDRAPPTPGRHRQEAKARIRERYSQ